mmetsp:Transcript_28614/g.85252  ORF Transcript_28614/g.85252 Transcript_28614/m.85252 type:complete len:255 (+) Transcript_28614:278-1042(+)
MYEPLTMWCRSSPPTRETKKEETKRASGWVQLYQLAWAMSASQAGSFRTTYRSRQHPRTCRCSANCAALSGGSCSWQDGCAPESALPVPAGSGSSLKLPSGSRCTSALAAATGAIEFVPAKPTSTRNVSHRPACIVSHPAELGSAASVAAAAVGIRGSETTSTRWPNGCGSSGGVFQRTRASIGVAPKPRERSARQSRRLFSKQYPPRPPATSFLSRSSHSREMKPRRSTMSRFSNGIARECAAVMSHSSRWPS